MVVLLLNKPATIVEIDGCVWGTEALTTSVTK